MMVGSNCYGIGGIKLIKLIDVGLVGFEFFYNFFIDVFFEEFCFFLYKKFFFCGKYVFGYVICIIWECNKVICF